MTATIRTTDADADAIRPYLDAVRAALAGAPVSTRDELLDDLAGHLAELAAEVDAPPLAERLGSPETYAAELVASAGITVESTVGAPREPLTDRARRWWSHPRVEAVRNFLPELRPGWWVLRGYAAVCAYAALSGDDESIVPIPDIGTNAFGALLVVAAIAASVRLGRRGPRGLDRLATFGGAVAVLAMFVSIDDGRDVYQEYDEPPTPGVLTSADGMPITNIWPYDGEGNPIEGVLLFDQNGQPVEIGEWDDGSTAPGAVLVPGLFPRPQVTYIYDERTGTERVEAATPPDVSVPRLPTTTTALPGP